MTNQNSIIGNSQSPKKVNSKVLDNKIQKAKNCFFKSKDGAIEAAARTYLIWFDTFSPSAHKDSRAWMEAQIVSRNEEIERHNKEEKDLKQRAYKFVNGRLSEDNWLNSSPDSQAEREELAKEKALLVELNNLTPQQWSARRKVAVHARKNASKFTKIVKFVFNFEYAAEASVTSRYATILEWIDTKFNDEAKVGLTQITNAVNEAGGLEAVLNEQRGNKSVDREAAAKDRKAVAIKNLADTKEVIRNAQANVTFKMDMKDVSEGIVLVLGRYVDGKVEVVYGIPLPDDQIDKICHTVFRGRVCPHAAQTDMTQAA